MGLLFTMIAPLIIAGVALYGVDHLIEEKQHSRDDADFSVMDSRAIRLREDIAEQLRALQALRRRPHRSPAPGPAPPL